jgi:pilus assembly protein CpaF
MEKLKEFELDKYMDNLEGNKKEEKVLSINKSKEIRFQEICKMIKDNFQREWETEQGKGKNNSTLLLERQKNAIIGYKKEVNFFKSKVKEFLKKNNLQNEWYPKWYIDLVDGIFHENWGLAGISKWMNLPDSTSAKIIGERIYFLIDGKSQLQKQTISKERYQQLRKALLLKTPEKRLDEKYTEVYMLGGERITIYDEGLTKEGQQTIVFRKYIIKDYTFEEQADKGTIPRDGIPMFKEMVDVGFNVAFTGAVRTAKSTMLQTWQSYEDPALEGLQVETDPEIALHELQPTAPIIQLVADGEELKKIVKSILRSDADYIIMAEARDGVTLDIAVKVANKGTRRVKITFHTTDSIDFCYDAADEIVKVYGGNLYSTIIKTAKSFHYIFQMVQLKDKSKKRLKGIYEIRYNAINHQISIHQICKYNYKTDDWSFKYDIGDDKAVIGEEENQEAFDKFRAELKKLAEKYPLEGNTVYIPAYNHLRGGA